MDSTSVNPRPILIGVLVGILLGGAVGGLIAYRRQQGGQTKIDARSAATAGFAAFGLAKQIIDMFSS
ncbi:MAG: hypothetical protein ACYC5O_10895 [Anaerolineae bacterium]